MLTEILDQWEVLVELQRQQATWQQRWDRAQADFQFALQQLDPHDADRLARVLAESLPAPLTPATHVTRQPASVPSHALRSQAHVPVTHATATPPTRATAHDFSPSVDPAQFVESLRTEPRREAPITRQYREPNPVAPALPNPVAFQPAEQSHSYPPVSGTTTSTPARSERPLASPLAEQVALTAPTPTQSQPVTKAKPAPTASITDGYTPPVADMSISQSSPSPTTPASDEAAIFAHEDDFFSTTLESRSSEEVNPPVQTTSNDGHAPAAGSKSNAQLDLLQWATDTIGDGITENELFQAMRKSPFAGQARQLFELLRERDAFYETDEEVIHVHSLRKIEEYQKT